MVGDEDRHNPYSDNKLCSLLTEEGFNIMRRTVAKYREELGIPCKSLRKSMCA
jgi:DNA-directed RNA polymerase specialized sigma subunit, sigma54 homolog